MKYILTLSARTIDTVSMEEKHIRIFEALKKVEGSWGLSKNAVFSTPSFGKEMFTSYKLTGKLGKGIKGDIMYVLRIKVENHHSFDDRIFIEFNSDKFDFENLVNYALPQYIEIFAAYTAAIYPEELIYVPKIVPFEVRQGMNMRKNIEFFYPFYYMDMELIENSFGRNPREVYDSFINQGIEIKKICKGLLLAAKHEYVSLQESLMFNLMICDKLNLRLPIGPIR